ncbi:MAG: hypothetical protein QXI64_09775 [Sulfolobales archaeon]
MGDEVKKGSVEENKADEIPKPASIKISPRISGDGKRIYFEISRGGETLAEIWVSRERKEGKNGEEITVVKAKLIPGFALKDLIEETAKPVICLVKKDEDLSKKIEKCFEGMGSVFEGIVGKDVYIDGKFVSGREVFTTLIVNAAANWDRYVDDLNEKMRERNREEQEEKTEEGRRRICLTAVWSGEEERCVKEAVIEDEGDLLRIYMFSYAKGVKLGGEIAVLPHIKKVRDPSGYLFAAFDGGKVIEVSLTLRGLLELLADREAVRYVVPLNMYSTSYFQKILSRIVEVEDGYVDAGITPEGIVDPRGVGLDLGEHPERVNTLVDIARWIEKAYQSEHNRRLALANVAFAMAKVLSPSVRMTNKTFVDNFIWNVGRGGEGKSSLVVYILLPLLGINDDINNKLFVYIRGAVRTPEQARNLISLNRMPLILDEQTKSALISNIDIIMSAAVGSGIIGVHAARYGGGIGYTFRSYRGVIIFTNVHFSRFMREVDKEVSDYAIARRVIELEWIWEKINPAAFEDLPRIKSILGILDAVWKRHKEELLKTSNIIELTLKLLDLLEKDYNVDLKVYREAVKYVWEIWRSGEKTFLKTDEDLLVERALEVSRRLLGDTNITALRLLESIIENPNVYGIKFTYSKSDGEELNEILRLRGIMCKAVGNPDPQDYHPLCGSTRNVKNELYSLDKKLRDYYEAGYTHVVIRARGPLCPGAPRRFLDSPEGGYSDGGTKFKGYKIPLSKLIEIFIGRASAKEETEDQSSSINTNIGETGGERGESGEAIDTAGASKDLQQSQSNDLDDHSKSLKSDTAINVSPLSPRSPPPGPIKAAGQQLQITPSNSGGGVSGFEALKGVVEKIEPGCYSEDELRQKLGELYDVVVGKLGVAKDKKICLGVEG